MANKWTLQAISGVKEIKVAQKEQFFIDKYGDYGINVEKNYKRWLSMISYIPQSIFLLDDTVRANVAFGMDPKDIDDEKIWEALSDAQLKNFVKKMDKGLDTTIGERGIRYHL